MKFPAFCCDCVTAEDTIGSNEWVKRPNTDFLTGVRHTWMPCSAWTTALSLLSVVLERPNEHCFVSVSRLIISCRECDLVNRYRQSRQSSKHKGSMRLNDAEDTQQRKSRRQMTDCDRQLGPSQGSTYAEVDAATESQVRLLTTRNIESIGLDESARIA